MMYNKCRMYVPKLSPQTFTLIVCLITLIIQTNFDISCGMNGRCVKVRSRDTSTLEVQRQGFVNNRISLESF